MNTREVRLQLTLRLAHAVIPHLDMSIRFPKVLLLAKLVLPKPQDVVALPLPLYIVLRILVRIRTSNQSHIPNLIEIEEDLVHVLHLPSTRPSLHHRSLAVDVEAPPVPPYLALPHLLQLVAARVAKPRNVVRQQEEGVCLDLLEVQLPKVPNEVDPSRVGVHLIRREPVEGAETRVQGKASHRKRETRDLGVQIRRVQIELTTRRRRSLP